MSAKERFKFIHINKAEYGVCKLCRLLTVSRQGYASYVKSLDKAPKHATLLAMIQAIVEEDIYNDTYGRPRILDALRLKGITISDSTLYRVCKKHGILAKKKSPKGLTKEEKEAYKDDDLLNKNLHQNFQTKSW